MSRRSSRPSIAFVWCILQIGGLGAQDFMDATVEFVNGTTEELTVLADDYKHLGAGVSVREADNSQRNIPADSIVSLTTSRGEFYRQVDFINRSPGVPREAVKRLARRLVEGDASLYRLDLLAGEKFVLKAGKDGGIHTYYLAVDASIEELRAEESVQRGTQYRKDDRYVGVLRYLLKGCEQVTALLEYEDIACTDAELGQVVRQYNACGNDIPSVKADRPRNTGAYVFEGIYARGGVLRDNRFDNVPASNAGFGGLSFAIRTPRISRRTSFTVGADFYRNRDTIAFDRRRIVTPVLSAVRVIVAAEQELMDPRHLVRPFLLAGAVWENGDSYGDENANNVKFDVGFGVKTDFLKLTVFNESIRQWNAAVTVRLWPLPWRGRERSE